jgi:hypothetical protein
MFDFWKWFRKKKAGGESGLSLKPELIESPITSKPDGVGHIDFKNLRPITKRFRIKGIEENRKKRQINPFYDKRGNLHQK